MNFFRLSFLVFSSVEDSPVNLPRVPFGKECGLTFGIKKLENLPVGPGVAPPVSRVDLAQGGRGLEAGNGRRLHLGIPEAVFVEDVDAFMAQPGNESADAALKKLDERYQKYKFMELGLAQRKRRLKAQIPEIKQTLEILKYMQRKKASPRPMETRFLLADNLYCKAAVPPTDRVCLWLGANVMLEYDVDEARALLERNLAAAARNLEALEDDLDFLRDQFTTTEVNMARVYNWDVKRRSRDDAATTAKGKA